MASILKVDSIGKTSGSTQDTMAGLAKSWFIFDQVNSNTLDDSFNIGSITDRGTGSMYGNFTNNMNTINYTVLCLDHLLILIVLLSL